VPTCTSPARAEATLDTVAQRIRTDGGSAYLALLDVLDRAAVEQDANTVAAASGAIDVCATSNDDVEGPPRLDMPFEDFLRWRSMHLHAGVGGQPVSAGACSHRATSRWVGRSGLEERNQWLRSGGSQG
jgi:NAD(P)-dependent dehydrogenase (short-subunit alcohol dehydrogenase family)